MSFLKDAVTPLSGSELLECMTNTPLENALDDANRGNPYPLQRLIDQNRGPSPLAVGIAATIGGSLGAAAYTWWKRQKTGLF